MTANQTDIPESIGLTLILLQLGDTVSVVLEDAGHTVQGGVGIAGQFADELDDLVHGLNDRAIEFIAVSCFDRLASLAGLNRAQLVSFAASLAESRPESTPCLDKGTDGFERFRKVAEWVGHVGSVEAIGGDRP